MYAIAEVLDHTKEDIKDIKNNKYNSYDYNVDVVVDIVMDR
jgi:hypothetical protein